MVLHRELLRIKNIQILYLVKFLSGLLFFSPILALYFEQNLFTATNVALIFTIQAITQAVFEAPSGAFADLFGRKKTLVLAYIAVFISIILLYFGGNFWAFSIYAVLFGISKSLKSGTTDAFIYDTLETEGKESLYKKATGESGTIFMVGMGVSSILGGYLAEISLSFPVGLALIPVSFAVLLTFFLDEPPFEGNHQNPFKQMRASFDTILGNTQLILLTLGSTILIMTTQSMHRLNPLFFEFKGVHIEFFGWITAAVFTLSAVGNYFTHELTDRFGDKKSLILAVFIIAVTGILATLTHRFVAVAFVLVSPFFFSVQSITSGHLLNKEISSDKRATVMSLSALLSQLSLAAFIPLVGYMADLWTINRAYQITSAIIFIVTLLYLFLNKEG